MGVTPPDEIPWPVRYELSKLSYRVDSNARRLDSLEPIVRSLADKDRLQTAMSDAVRDLGTDRWTKREKVIGLIVAFSAIMGDAAALATFILH